MTIVRHGRAIMDGDTVLLLPVTVTQLKTMSASAVMRQARMLQIAKDEANAHNWEFVDAANIEAEKSYKLGIWAEGHLNALTPDRIEDEWVEDPSGRLIRRSTEPPGSYYNPVEED